MHSSAHSLLLPGASIPLTHQLGMQDSHCGCPASLMGCRNSVIVITQRYPTYKTLSMSATRPAAHSQAQLA